MPSLYCKTALFKCSCCSYEEEIYSDTEWLEENWTEECKSCHKINRKNFDFGVISRPDIYEEVLLHPQCAYLPKHLNCCSECSGRERIHWTELLVHCPNCPSDNNLGCDTMVFNKYVKGKLHDYFYNVCIDLAKPSYPQLTFIDENGHEIYYIGGLESEISAS